MTTLRVNRRVALILAAGTFLAGCTANPMTRTLPGIAFDSARPLLLDVAAIEFVNATGDQNITESLRDMRFAMYESPGSVALRWSRERFEAAGTQGVARIILVESRFVAEELETESGIEGIFTDEQSVRYEGSMALKIEIADHPSGHGFAEARSARSRTVPESLSLNEREDVLHSMLAGIAAKLDERLEAEIREHLWRWLMTH